MTEIQHEIAACINAPLGIQYISPTSLRKFAGWLRTGAATPADFREVGGDELVLIATSAADVCPTHEE